MCFGALVYFLIVGDTKELNKSKTLNIYHYDTPKI